MNRAHFKNYQVNFHDPTIRLSLVFEFSQLQQSNENKSMDEAFRCETDFLKTTKLSVIELMFCTKLWSFPRVRSREFDRMMGGAVVENGLIKNAPEIHARELLCKQMDLPLFFEAWEREEPLFNIRKNLAKEYRVALRREVSRLRKERELNLRKNIDLDEWGEPLEDEFLAYDKGITYGKWHPRPPMDVFIKNFSVHAQAVDRFLSEHLNLSPITRIYDDYYKEDVANNWRYQLIKNEILSHPNDVISASANIALFLVSRVSHLSIGPFLHYETLIRLEEILSKKNRLQDFQDRILSLKLEMFANGEIQSLMDKDIKRKFEVERTSFAERYDLYSYLIDVEDRYE